MIENIRNIIQKIARNSLLQHSLFWAISYYILLRFFAYHNEIFKSDLISTLPNNFIAKNKYFSIINYTLISLSLFFITRIRAFPDLLPLT